MNKYIVRREETHQHFNYLVIGRTVLIDCEGWYVVNLVRILSFYSIQHFHSPFKSPFPNSEQTVLGWSLLTDTQKPFLPGSVWWEEGGPCFWSLPGDEAGLFPGRRLHLARRNKYQL